jgi:hypothetical protein
MANLTKDHAQVICRKLEAVDETPKGAAHERHCVYYGKVLLGHVGIRHGSRRDQSHDHIPKDLNIPPRFAFELATCTKYRDDYLEKVGAIKTHESNEVALPPPPPKYPWQKDWVAIQETEAKELPAPEPESPDSAESSS